MTNAEGRPPLASRPVFVHGMWRTGSTYIWKKFRDLPGYRAYYEPLNETLWIVRPVETEIAPEYTTKMRHPEMKEPFWKDFPLRAQGGVEHFLKVFSYEQYCLEPEARSPSLFRYIENLISFAELNGQVPVLQFNRALLRSGWLCKNFKPRTILLLRNPLDIWQSFLSVNDYFVSGICLIIGQNRRHKVLGKIAERYDVPFFRGVSFVEEGEFYSLFALSKLDELYPMFYEFYMLTCLYNVAFADCVIDMNAVSTDSRKRSLVTDSLESLGIQISLDDCAIPSYPIQDRERKWQSCEPEARARLQAIVPPEWRVPADALKALSPMLTEYFQENFSIFKSK